MLALVIWYLALVALRFIPGVEGHDTIFMIVAAVSAVMATVVMMALGKNVEGRLELYPDRIVLGARTIERQGLRAELAQWKQANLWTTLGSAIHLQTARESFFIGGRDCLLARGTLPSTQKVAASLSTDDFVQFVRALDLPVDLLAGTDTAGPLAVDLQTSGTSLRGMWGMMSPWVGTIVLAGAVGVLAGTTPILQTGAGLVAIQIITVVIVIGGLVFTVRKNLRPPAVRYRLFVEPTRVALRDLRAQGGPIDPFIPKPQAAPMTYRMTSRGGTFEFPALRLEWPSKSMTVGVWDATLSWPAGTKRTRKLDYLIGPEEWRHLVRTLGLG